MPSHPLLLLLLSTSTGPFCTSRNGPEAIKAACYSYGKYGKDSTNSTCQCLGLQIYGSTELSEETKGRLEKTFADVTAPRAEADEFIRIVADCQRMVDNTIEPTRNHVALSRTMCFGTCPVYTVTLVDDGRVIFDGQEYVRTTSVVKAQIASGDFKKLADELLKANIFGLSPGDGKQVMTDESHAILDVFLRGKARHIDHYLGDPSASKQLLEIEKRIDEVANTKRWIK
jgi:hypothetical protein